MLGAAAIGIDQQRNFGGVIRGEQDAYRWFASMNVNMFTEVGDFYVDLSTGLLYARDHLNAFTENGGTLLAGGLVNPATSIRLGQWRVGGTVSYPLGDIEVFGAAYHAYDFTRTKVIVGPTQAAPSDDRTELQLGGGVRYVGSEGLSASVEYTTIHGRTNLDADIISAFVSMEF